MLFENDVNPLTMMIWGITIASIFVIMVFGICRNIKILRERNRDTTARIQELLLCDMLERIHINRKDYFHKTTDQDKERHIQECENCAKPEECERMLLGEEIDPHTFCPNIDELENLKED